MQVKANVHVVAKIFVFCLISVLSSVTQSLGVTYYVAPTGSDANPGTEVTPWLTLQKAADTAAAGDEIVVKDGVYTSSGSQVIKLHTAGTPGAYITFRAENRHGAVLDGLNYTTDWGIIFWAGSAYIRIIGFEIRNFDYTGIYAWSSTSGGLSSHHNEIRNCWIHNNGYVAVTSCSSTHVSTGISSNPLTHHYIVDGCTINSNGRNSAMSCQEHAYRHDHGLYLQGKYWTVTNNILYDHWAGWAIKVDGYFGDTIGNEEYTHIIANNTFGDPVRTDSAGGGHIRFYNNRSYNSTYGTMKSPRPLIQNNVFYKPAGPASSAAIRITSDVASNFAATIRNNVTDAPYMYDPVASYVTASNNVTGINPLDFAMKDPDQHDYALTDSVSYLLDHGTADQAPAADYLSVSRPHGDAHDIGAYEFRREDDASYPSSPQGLRIVQ